MTSKRATATAAGITTRIAKPRIRSMLRTISLSCLREQFSSGFVDVNPNSKVPLASLVRHHLWRDVACLSLIQSDTVATGDTSGAIEAMDSPKL